VDDEVVEAAPSEEQRSDVIASVQYVGLSDVSHHYPS